MACRLLICLLHFVSFTLSASTEISGPGVCMLPNSTIIKCCAGYMLVGNMCLECNPGYAGKNCSLTCSYGYFGRRCNERCRCSQDEYCDPARGCLCNSTSDYCREPDAPQKSEISSPPDDGGDNFQDKVMAAGYDEENFQSFPDDMALLKLCLSQESALLQTILPASDSFTKPVTCCH